MTRYSLLTKTYKGDLLVFERLCESIDKYLPDVVHYVLVDKTDIDLFQRFSSDLRILVDCQELLPKFHEFNIFGERGWLRFPCWFVRGWIYQQLAKIQFVSTCDEEAIVLVDSDAVFVRSIDEQLVFSGDSTRLFHNPGAASGPEAESDKWHNVALEAFGLPAMGYTGADYISQAVIWSPKTVRAMMDRIEEVARRKWFDSLIRNFRFSEYVLYGVFCEKYLTADKAGIVPTDKELCHCSWHYDLSSKDGVETFVRSIKDHHVSILIQSNLGLPAERTKEILQEFAEQTERLS